MDTTEKSNLLKKATESDTKPTLLDAKSTFFSQSTHTLPDYDPTKRELIRMIVYLVSGGLVLLFPAVYLMVAFDNTKPNLEIGKSYDELMALGQLDSGPQAVRWSLWLTCVWCESISWWYLIPNLPKITVRVITRIYGGCSELLLDRLDVH
jgi:hypothetical protein